MSTDTKGNDITAVGLPVTGFAAFAPAATAVLPTPTEGADPDFVLPAAWRKAGLMKTDGGFDWTLEPDGDPIEFYQEGYSIPSGLANATVVIGLAQYDETVRELAYGKTADANGFIEIDASGNTNRYAGFTEEIFKNGVIRRRVWGDSSVSAAQDKSERGTTLGTNVTFDIARVAGLGNNHLGEWLIAPETADTGS